MNILEVIGIITIVISVPILLYKLYRYMFGYSWETCPNNHATMTRRGASRCNKCKSSLIYSDYLKEKYGI